MKTRILSLLKIPGANYLIVGDHRGVLYKLDHSLNIIAISRKVLHIGGLHVMTTDGHYIYARDTLGNLGKWDLATLEPTDFVCTEHYTLWITEEDLNDHPEMPVPAGALTLWKDNLVTVNSRGELIVLDLKSLEVNKILNWPSVSFAENILLSENGDHYLADCAGQLWKGNFDTNTFSELFRVNFGNAHCIRYDKRHNRYWVSTDTFGGFWIFQGDGTVTHRVKMTNDDVEWIDFNANQSMVYLACFDHYLYIYSNLEVEPKLIKKVGPFKFMLKQVVVLNDDNIYILLQSGHIYLYSSTRDKIIKEVFGTNCVWSINPVSSNSDTVCCAMEDGTIATFEYGYCDQKKYYLCQISKSRNLGNGVVRKALSLLNGDFLATTENGSIVRLNNAFEVLWEKQIGYLSRDIDINQGQSRCIVCSDTGDFYELDLVNGQQLYYNNFKYPVYSLCYDNQGGILLATKIFSEFTEEGEYDAITSIKVLNDQNYHKIAEIPVIGNIKRMKRMNDGNILINGSGNVFVTIIDPKSYTIKSSYKTWLLNTTENAINLDEKIYAVTYGYQLNTYDFDTQDIIDSQFTLEDYPKSLHTKVEANGKKVLLVGGRGFISLYDISGDTPQLVKTNYI